MNQLGFSSKEKRGFFFFFFLTKFIDTLSGEITSRGKICIITEKRQIDTNYQFAVCVKFL